jgi:hypothetical protein
MVVRRTLRGGRLILSTACLVLAVACGGGSDGKAQTSPEDDRIIAEIAFAKTLADRAPSLNSGDHAALVGLGQSVCDRLRSGTSFGEVGRILMETLSVQEAAAVAGAAVASFCPEFTSAVR